MKSKNWMIGFLIIFLCLFVLVNGLTIYIDPFFHFHKPYTDKFYYTLDNERSMNDGILRHFDYDAVITGTSMTENFKTSEADEIFNADFVKVPYSGASMEEINSAEKAALENNANIKIIIRALDGYKLLNDEVTAEGEMPDYLYDSNPFNDIYYTLNRDVIYSRCIKMIESEVKEGKAGITSFDKYANWTSNEKYGSSRVLVNQGFKPSTKQIMLSEKEKKKIIENVKKNITDLAEEYQNVDFYYFITPYSSVYYGDLNNANSIGWYLEQIRVVAEEVFKYKNIHLFAWDDHFEITSNLNNYCDIYHYGEWINSWMLREMKEGNGLLTEDNYEDYLERIKEYYSTYNFNSLFDQIDYKDNEYKFEY